MFRPIQCLLLSLFALHSATTQAQLILQQLFSGNGGVLNTNSSGVPSITATPTLGVGSTATGKITFQNSSNNNTATLQPGAAASNLTWTLPTTDSTGVQCLSSNGSGTLSWSNCGSNALSSIVAATGANTISSGDNDQTWQWAQTTDSTNAMYFRESAAATGGTMTSGIPNQNLIRIGTVAASTSAPLRVDSRGSHVFSINSISPQILGTNGSAASPVYSFASATNTGIYMSGGNMTMSLGGSGSFVWLSSTGQLITGLPLSFSAPQFANSNASNGITMDTSIIGAAINSAENSRWILNAYQVSRGTADSSAYALNFRKSRGTVASPTVITTGDALSTISGFGYVGGSNTYREATRIEFDSTGTIADSATGIGGIVKIMTTLAGTDSAVQEAVRFAGGSQPYSQWTGVAFANLPGTPVNGMFLYCSDCTIANPCASGGSGAFAKRLNGAWICN